MKKETTVEAHKFIHKYTPSNLINKMDDCRGKNKLLKSAKKRKGNFEWTNEYKTFGH